MSKTYKIPTIEDFIYKAGNDQALKKCFEDWPRELNNFPDCVKKQWPFRHRDARNAWFCGQYDIEKWSFSLGEFSNPEILKIKHIDKQRMEELDKVIKCNLTDPRRNQSKTWLEQFLFENGTFPVPIIVAVDAGRLSHPLQLGFPNETMSEPTQLIEGNRRLGNLRYMIKSNNPNLKEKHQVWVMKFNHT